MPIDGLAFRPTGGLLVPSRSPLLADRAITRLQLFGNDHQRTVTMRDWDLLSPEAPVMVSV